jgi:hypothetical protein
MATTKTPKRPTSIKVGYIDFEVRYLEDDQWKADPSLGEGDGGQCDGAKAVISVRLAEGQHDIHVKEILLHETLHACFYASGITINDDLRIYPDIEEGIVARVAPVLLDVIRSNPEFAGFLES